MRAGSRGRWILTSSKHRSVSSCRGICPRTQETEQYVGRYRVEIIPTNPSLRDVFLNVIEVTDAGVSAPAPAASLSGTDMAAARVGNRIAAFSSRTRFACDRQLYRRPGRNLSNSHFGSFPVDRLPGLGGRESGHAEGFFRGNALFRAGCVGWHQNLDSANWRGGFASAGAPLQRPHRPVDSQGFGSPGCPPREPTPLSSLGELHASDRDHADVLGHYHVVKAVGRVPLEHFVHRVFGLRLRVQLVEEVQDDRFVRLV